MDHALSLATAARPPHAAGRRIACVASLGLHVVALGLWIGLVDEPEPKATPEPPTALSVALVTLPAPTAEPLTQPVPPPPAPAAPRESVEPAPRPAASPRSSVPIERDGSHEASIAAAPAEPRSSIDEEPQAPAPSPAPTPTRVPEAARAERAAVVASYVGRVRSLIDARKRYPRQAQRRRLEGTVLMRLHLTSLGAVSAVDVLQDPHPLLEKASREAVERVGEFPPPPDGVSLIEIPVNYRLES